MAGILAVAVLYGVRADPFPLDSLQPRSVSPGRSEITVATGVTHPGARLWTSFPATVEPAELRGDRLVFRIQTDATPGIGIVRISGTNGISQPALVLIDPLPTLPEAVTNQTATQARRLVPPVAVESGIQDAGSSWFAVQLRRGAPLDLEVFAQRLGSPLDPFLRIHDPAGTTVAAVDDPANLERDAVLHWTAATAGLHRIEVRDSSFAGGKDQRFRLRLGDPARTNWSVTMTPGLVPEVVPDVPTIPVPAKGGTDTPVPLPCFVTGMLGLPRQADTLRVDGKKGDWIWLKAATRSLGWPGDVAVQLEDLQGRLLAEMDATGPDDGSFGYRFEGDGQYRIRVRKLAEEGPSRLAYRLLLRGGRGDMDPQADRHTVEVHPGETFSIQVTIQRRDLDQPVRFRAVGLPEAFKSEEVTADAKAKEATIKVTVPANAAPGTLVHMAIDGVAGDIRQRVGTRTALVKTWPSLLQAPPGFDGVIAVGIVSK
jgi:hypothetical protein